MPTDNSSILALDVGERRIGIAVASWLARLPRSLPTLARSDTALRDIANLIREHDVSDVVVGLPRSLDGGHTAQTRAVQAFAEELQRLTPVKIHFQDEALTSRQAENELQSRNMAYTKEAVDALSATYILEDFLAQHRGGT